MDASLRQSHSQSHSHFHSPHEMTAAVYLASGLAVPMPDEGLLVAAQLSSPSQTLAANAQNHPHQEQHQSQSHSHIGSNSNHFLLMDFNGHHLHQLFPLDQHQQHMHHTQHHPPPEEPMYVNAKQYNRILKRREARARLFAKFKQNQSGPSGDASSNGSSGSGSAKGAPHYAHESRHLHAMRRPRGPGGRFLTAAELAALREVEASGSGGGVAEAIAIVAALNARKAAGSLREGTN
ncbi:Transcriptional activator [Entophlyctis luteolus]|nr:Transcriptional activator [Entophlyctis luteolus]